MLKRTLFFCAVFAVFAAAQADPPQYTVVILDPGSFADSQGLGIGFGQQVGQAKWNGLQDPNEYATLWTGTAASAVNLNPVGVMASVAQATDGVHQVGATIFLINGGSDGNAAMWQGTAASYINMSPPNSSRSYMSAIDGGREVGGATINGADYAGYWTGTNPASFTPLPAPPNEGVGVAISGNVIVGALRGSTEHAYVWNISTHVNQDLNPAGVDNSALNATDGVQHVGITQSQPDFHPRAGVWDAATGNFTDLHPAGGWTESYAEGVHGGVQVGYVHGFNQTVGGFDRAAIWQGTAASYEDLQQFLPSTYIDSYAAHIDAQGNIVGWGQDSALHKNRALMWVPLVQNPPPYTFVGFKSSLNDPATPESKFKGNRTIPIRFSLLDEGLPVISAHCTISLDKISGNSLTPVDPSLFEMPSDDGDQCQLDGMSGTYSYNLNTRRLTPGKYRVTVTVAETQQTHSVTFRVL